MSKIQVVNNESVVNGSIADVTSTTVEIGRASSFSCQLSTDNEDVALELFGSNDGITFVDLSIGGTVSAGSSGVFSINSPTIKFVEIVLTPVDTTDVLLKLFVRSQF